MKTKIITLALAATLLTGCAGSALQVNSAVNDVDLRKACEARAPLQAKVNQVAEAAETADSYTDIAKVAIRGTVGGILTAIQSAGRVVYDIGGKVVNSEKELAADARCQTLQ